MKIGIRKVSLPIIVAAAATPQNLYLVSAAGTATRTAIIRKLLVYSNVAGNPVLQIGTGLGAGWAVAMPQFLVINGVTNMWEEAVLPAVEFGVNITCQSSILGIVVQIEVEEIGA